jgi:hypothetical protein
VLDAIATRIRPRVHDPELRDNIARPPAYDTANDNPDHAAS